jgi:hypothetical protein
MGLNDIGMVEIEVARAIPAVRYEQNRKLGGFILIDKLNHATVAAGLIEGFPAAPKLTSQEQVFEDIRWIAGPKRHAWAEKAAKRLRSQGEKAIILDDSAVAAFRAPDLIRTARQAARLLASAGIHVFVTFEVAPSEARPGRLIDPETEDDGGEEWVI